MLVVWEGPLEEGASELGPEGGMGVWGAGLQSGSLIGARGLGAADRGCGWYTPRQVSRTPPPQLWTPTPHCLWGSHPRAWVSALRRYSGGGGP